MTTPNGFDFTKYVPGFDFLKNLTPGSGTSASSAASPGWVAPTLDPEELEKRIQELKTVQFWLEQNAKAVGATIQALEVQRMTLATLKGMNMSFQDLADSLKVKPQEASSHANYASQEEPSKPKFSFETEAEKPTAKPKPRTKTSAKNEAAGVDPSHWWGALTDQFQHIAKHAMKDMADRAHAHSSAPATAQTTPKTTAKTTAKAKAPVAKKAAAKKVVRKSSGRKTTERKPTASKITKR
jgi:hypothetical protein